MNNDREFGKLLAASFISQTGSHFLTLALSAFILLNSGSPVQAGLVFVVSYFPSILVGARLGHWVDSNISRLFIARNELISVLATVICGVCIGYRLPLSVLCAVLAFRSLLMFVGRAAATKWLKLITPPAAQTRRIKLFYLSFFLSTAFSGILVSLVLRSSSIWMTVTVDALSYLVGVALYLMLRPVPREPAVSATTASAAEPPALAQTLRMIFAMPSVRTSFLLVCGTQALFQGAYSAFVSYLPIAVFHLGVAGVGAFQLAASVGITGGFLVNWLAPSFLTEADPSSARRSLILSGLTLVCLLGAVAAPGAGTGLLSFLALNLAYETVWLHHNSEFFRASPKHHAARYQFTLASCSAFLMSATTLAYSVAVQCLGPVAGTVSVLMMGLLLAAIAGLASAPAEASPMMERR